MIRSITDVKVVTSDIAGHNYLIIKIKFGVNLTMKKKTQISIINATMCANVMVKRNHRLNSSLKVDGCKSWKQSHFYDSIYHSHILKHILRFQGFCLYIYFLTENSTKRNYIIRNIKNHKLSKNMNFKIWKTDHRTVYIIFYKLKVRCCGWKIIFWITFLFAGFFSRFFKRFQRYNNAI